MWKRPWIDDWGYQSLVDYCTENKGDPLLLRIATVAYAIGDELYRIAGKEDYREETWNHTVNSIVGRHKTANTVLTEAIGLLTLIRSRKLGQMIPSPREQMSRPRKKVTYSQLKDIYKWCIERNHSQIVLPRELRDKIVDAHEDMQNVMPLGNWKSMVRFWDRDSDAQFTAEEWRFIVDCIHANTSMQDGTLPRWV